MRKAYPTILSLFIAAVVFAQKNEFLVYAVKNPVSILENKKESQLRIGRILRDTATIVVKKGGAVTIICNGLNVFTIRKEGKFQLIPFNDSCRSSEESVLSNYFHYIWQQMYVRSPDNPHRALMNNAGSVIRGPEVEFSELLDTIRYATGSLQLGWQVKNYKGDHVLNLYNATTKELVYTKNLSSSSFMMEDLAKWMKPGSSYYWTISLKGWGVSDQKWIYYVSNEQVKEFIASLPEPGDIAEDSAMRFFRIGYMLENASYLADAYSYYQQAAKAETASGMCSDKFKAFKKELGSKSSD